MPPKSAAVPSHEGLATVELAELFYEHLKLCAVQEGERVVVHTDSFTMPHFGPAFVSAAQRLGADVFQIVHPRGTERSVGDVWNRADMVIDLATGVRAYSEVLKDALLAGTRVLRVAESEQVMRRLFPTSELRARVQAGQRIMQEGKVMRITSPGGTDLTFYKEGRDALGIYSCADEPGHWDIWPAGMVCCAPHEDRGEGVLVLSPGDMMLVFGKYVRETVRIEIADGRIQSIEGGLEATLLKEWFARWRDPNVYRIAHIGWGCERRADWLKWGQDNESYYANMQIAFGANVGAFTQGQTRARGHFDFPCLNNSYWVDDIQIQADGEFLLDELRYREDETLGLAAANGRQAPLQL
jgi:2,5-dihydroxypyridine 5,6-dioxygenase